MAPTIFDSDSYTFILDNVEAAIVEDTSTLENLTMTIQVASTNGDYQYLGVSSASMVSGSLYITAEAVPEPSTSALSLMALAGLLARRRRRKA